MASVFKRASEVVKWHWVQGHGAVNSLGESVLATHESAVRWCAQGAIILASGNKTEVYTPALQLLDSIAERYFGCRLIALNDYRFKKPWKCQRAVLWVLKRAHKLEKIRQSVKE
jgi:hypothetical protein